MKVLSSLLLFTSISLSALSQKTIGTIAMQGSFPSGEYHSTDPTAAFGLRFSVLHRFNEDIPVSIGGELGYMVAGSTSRTFDAYYLGYYDRYRISASSNIVPILFKTRIDLASDHEKVQAFFDATIGTNLFYSSANVERETFFGGTQTVDGNTTESNWALVFGPGFGIEIPLGKRKTSALVFKGAYLYGSNTKYYTDPSITSNGQVFFTQKESKTNVITVDVGLRLGFFKDR